MIHYDFLLNVFFPFLFHEISVSQTLYYFCYRSIFKVTMPCSSLKKYWKI